MIHHHTNDADAFRATTRIDDNRYMYIYKCGGVFALTVDDDIVHRQTHKNTKAKKKMQIVSVQCCAVNGTVHEPNENYVHCAYN